MVYISDILPEEFLDKYKENKPDWGYNGLGEIVYKRTYSRLKEDGTNEESSPTTEGFSNMKNLNLNSGRSLWSLDLFLKAILFACLFYVLAHNKTRAAVTKYIVRGKENVSYVLMLVFAVVYYLLHLVV